MKTPSIKTLSICFDDPKRAKHFLTCDTREIKTPAAESLRRQCYNLPAKYRVRLTALNELAELHGVEAAESSNGEYFEYLNTGDTYAPTVIYWRGKYRVQSVGDFVETMERQGVKFP